MLLRHYLRHDFDRTFEAEAFARPDIQLIGNRIQLFLAVDRQALTFGQILADQAVEDPFEQLAAGHCAVAPDLAADGGRAAVEQAGELALAEVAQQANLDRGALGDAEFVTGRGDTLPKRSDVALGFPERHRKAEVRARLFAPQTLIAQRH